MYMKALEAWKKAVAANMVIIKQEIDKAAQNGASSVTYVHILPPNVKILEKEGYELQVYKDDGRYLINFNFTDTDK